MGHATATVRHASLRGARLVLVQPLRSLTLEPLLALDRLGTAPGDTVVITSDGLAAREMLGDTTSPARWSIAGLIDEPAGVTRVGHGHESEVPRTGNEARA
jgi:ethanolamine utilization protein EutN